MLSGASWAMPLLQIHKNVRRKKEGTVRFMKIEIQFLTPSEAERLQCSKSAKSNSKSSISSKIKMGNIHARRTGIQDRLGLTAFKTKRGFCFFFAWTISIVLAYHFPSAMVYFFFWPVYRLGITNVGQCLGLYHHDKRWAEDDPKILTRCEFDLLIPFNKKIRMTSQDRLVILCGLSYK